MTKTLFTSLTILQITFLTAMILCERKNLKTIVFWFFVIVFFPIFGFLIYCVFGNRLKFKSKQKIIENKITTKNYLKHTSWYKPKTAKNLSGFTKTQIQIVNKLKNNYNANLWQNNKLKIYTSGQKFLTDFLKDLKQAKQTINLQFYIFADDAVGRQVCNVLKQKAKDGVLVNVLFDAIGSKKTSKKQWKRLKNVGVRVVSFFPPTLGAVNFKLNYRNHRKIAVIDGKICYTGGLNLRNDHMGRYKKLSPWRDTHLKIVGSGAYAHQDIFLNDFNFAFGQNVKIDADLYFPQVKPQGTVPISVVQSGPESDQNSILNSYMYIIKKAEKFLYIQTPYFIVKQKLIEQILNAKKRGVNVAVFIPKIPDKQLVYIATLKCIEKLLNGGVNVYLFNGFIHAKVMLTESVLCVGSCNFDNRSFELNFESTCVIYSQNQINNYVKQIKKDALNSTPLTKKLLKKISSKNIVVNILYKLLYRIM